MGFQLSEIKMIGLSRYRQKFLSLAKRKVLLSFPEKLKKVLFYGKTYYCPVCESHISKIEPFSPINQAW